MVAANEAINCAALHGSSSGRLRHVTGNMCCMPLDCGDVMHQALVSGVIN